jgi:FO synthase
MNESITRAAGAIHGQEMTPETLEGTIRSCGRQPWQRNTLYARNPAGKTDRTAPELTVQIV